MRSRKSKDNNDKKLYDSWSQLRPKEEYSVPDIFFPATKPSANKVTSIPFNKNTSYDRINSLLCCPITINKGDQLFSAEDNDEKKYESEPDDNFERKKIIPHNSRTGTKTFLKQSLQTIHPGKTKISIIIDPSQDTELLNRNNTYGKIAVSCWPAFKQIASLPDIFTVVTTICTPDENNKKKLCILCTAEETEIDIDKNLQDKDVHDKDLHDGVNSYITSNNIKKARYDKYTIVTREYLPLIDHTLIDPATKKFVSFQTLEKTFSKIEEKRREGYNVLVHCFSGIGRSPLICSMYISWSEGKPLNKALELIKKKRPIAHDLSEVKSHGRAAYSSGFFIYLVAKALAQKNGELNFIKDMPQHIIEAYDCLNAAHDNNKLQSDVTNKLVATLKNNPYELKTCLKFLQEMKEENWDQIDLKDKQLIFSSLLIIKVWMQLQKDQFKTDENQGSSELEDILTRAYGDSMQTPQLTNIKEIHIPQIINLINEFLEKQTDQHMKILPKIINAINAKDRFKSLFHISGSSPISSSKLPSNDKQKPIPYFMPLSHDLNCSNDSDDEKPIKIIST